MRPGTYFPAEEGLFCLCTNQSSVLVPPLLCVLFELTMNLPVLAFQTNAGRHESLLLATQVPAVGVFLLSLFPFNLLDI